MDGLPAVLYLNLAEAVLRGGQGATKAEALGYLNDPCLYG